MLRTSRTKLAKNLLLLIDGAEDSEVGSGMNSIIRSAKNLPLDMAENAEVGGNGDSGNNEMVKRSPLSKMLSGSTGVFYLLTLQKKLSFPG